MARENSGQEAKGSDEPVVQDAKWIPRIGWILRLKPKNRPPLTITLPVE